MKNLLLLSLILCLLPWIASQENIQSRPFQVTIVGELKMATGQKIINALSSTQYEYSHIWNEKILTLMLNTISVKASVNGQPTMDITMSKDGIKAMSPSGKPHELKIDKAPDALKLQLEHSFLHPLCKITWDQSGKENREIIAKEGATSLITNGILSNLRLFHPAFIAQEAWEYPAEISMGNGLAKGTLTYTKTFSDASKTKVKVSGKLLGNASQGPMQIKDAEYVVNGTQEYNHQLQEWVQGELTVTINGTLSVESQETKLNGTMKFQFSYVGEK